jgi:hypothetical protein
MYDKNLSRKSNTKFNPKGTIEKLKYGLEINTEDLLKAKQELIAYYLEVYYYKYKFYCKLTIIYYYFS